MKHWGSTLWSLGFAMIGFAILFQMGVAIIAPYKGWLVTGLIIFSVIWLVTGARKALKLKDGHDDGLRRGR